MVGLNLYCKMAKTVCLKDASNKAKVEKSCAKIIKVIETQCEKDKTMSNLKGKVKELKKIIEM